MDGMGGARFPQHIRHASYVPTQPDHLDISVFSPYETGTPSHHLSSSPYSQVVGFQNFTHFPPFSPLPSDQNLTENRTGIGIALPHSMHTGSSSDNSFGFNAVPHSSTTSLVGSSRVDIPMQSKLESFPGNSFGTNKGNEWMGKRKTEDESVDDLFTTYMNLDTFNTPNSCGAKKIGGGDSDNEVERVRITAKSNGEGIKRRQHFRSVSVDSFIADMNFGEESLKPPPSPNLNRLGINFDNSEFSAAEMDKIATNEKLAEIASLDPRRAKRILANRMSAARSKERKMRYISELEHKVQTLQTEATTLSTQVTLFQRDFSASTSQNKELKFRVEALEQQAKLKDALNQALNVEVQRLRLAATEFSAPDSQSSN